MNQSCRWNALRNGGDDVRALGLAGVVAQLGNGPVRDLVDDAVRQRFEASPAAA
jgi:hypothetical protein